MDTLPKEKYRLIRRNYPMAPNTPIYHAEQCHTGGYPCRHKHRTRAAAERCLPRLGRHYRNGEFSMAKVVAGNDAARRQDR